MLRVPICIVLALRRAKKLGPRAAISLLCCFQDTSSYHALHYTVPSTCVRLTACMLDLSAWHFITQHRLCSLPELRQRSLRSCLWALTPGNPIARQHSLSWTTLFTIIHAKDTSPLNAVKFLHCGVTATENILTANEQQRQKTMP